MTDKLPDKLIDWKGNNWSPASGSPAAHPNSRFCVPSSECPTMDPKWEDPQGVPISAIIFGGRRSSVVPLTYQSFNWQHGVFLGASMSSERTAAAEGTAGELRHDPFAMLPFCGYHMGEYFGHWLSMPKRAKPANLPKIFFVNWFKKKDGKFLWPGFGENSRILKWVYERCDGAPSAIETPIGYVPKPGAIDLKGLNIPEENLKELFRVDNEDWKKEADELQDYFKIFGDKFPDALNKELQGLRQRLAK
jgi:phosphoenolpyruvate carboxykinase (GTP)